MPNLCIACPNCGSEKLSDKYEGMYSDEHRLCADCGQEWFTDVFYPWEGSHNPLGGGVEVRFDMQGNVLKIAPYPFRRIHEEGETFIDDGQAYRVLKSSMTKGSLGAFLVETVVEAIVRTLSRK